MSEPSLQPYLAAVQRIHDHFKFREQGGEDMFYRLTSNRFARRMKPHCVR